MLKSSNSRTIVFSQTTEQFYIEWLVKKKIN